MSLLNFEPSSPERTGKKRNLKVVFGVGAIAAVMDWTSVCLVH
jgi:hypothetical protein